jgi:hypothetical protein
MTLAFAGLRGPIRLSTDTFATLWDYDSRGPIHAALPVSAPARTGEDPTAAERRMTVELQGKGLSDGTAVHPDLRGACELIERAEREFHGWLAFGSEQQISVLVAARCEVAIRAVLDGDTVYLEPAPAGNPAGALVALLPPAAARRRRLTARLSEVASAGSDFLVGDQRPDDDDQKAQLRALLRARRTGGGACNAAVRRTDGTRTRASRPLNYIDVDGFRWLLRASDWGGDEWVTAAPASAEDVTAALAQLVDRR